ncbi:MAG: helix-turn-helix protein [Burkholderia sp.]|nr:helix-turn-helix protein [Burkholderia sp.]
MSISFMTLAWKADIPSGRKLVLLALCDHANAHGECYPSVDAIARKCSMGQRTVQQHISELENAEILIRHFRKGRSTVYRLQPCNFCSTAESAAPQDSAFQCAASAASPPQLLHGTPAVYAPRSVSEASMQSLPNHQVARGMPLPATWALPQAWEQWALEAQPAWNAAQVLFVAEKFRDHWSAIGGQRGIKADWFSAWRNWCRNEKPAGLNSHAIQRQWSAAPTTPVAQNGARTAKPLPGESYATFIARVTSDAGNDGTATGPTRPTLAAHIAVPTKSAVSPANRAAALDAARALKSRPIRSTGESA